MEGIDSLLTLIKWQLIPEIILLLFVQHLWYPDAVRPWTAARNPLTTDLAHILLHSK